MKSLLLNIANRAMRTPKIFVPFVFIFVVESGWAQLKGSGYIQSSVEKSSKEFAIPREIRERVEQSYLSFIKKENPKLAVTDEDILAKIPREYLNTEVLLTAAAQGTLIQNSSIVLPRGGGEIDLKNYVVGSKGSFFVKFKNYRTGEPDKKLENLAVYFLSETKSKKFERDTFGSGCGKFMDLTDYIGKINAAEGIPVNATGARYLPVIGGTFYFFNFDPQRKLFISAVKFTDSRYPSSCEL